VLFVRYNWHSMIIDWPMPGRGLAAGGRGAGGALAGIVRAAFDHYLPDAEQRMAMASAEPDLRRAAAEVWRSCSPPTMTRST
jgi:hypothetical protein